jgi:hypothetical protein
MLFNICSFHRSHADPVKLPQAYESWFRKREVVVRKRRKPSISPTRRSQRISQKQAAQVAAEAVSVAVDAESFELDEVAQRLRAGKRHRGKRRSVGVCIYACGEVICSHQKMHGPTQNYTP